MAGVLYLVATPIGNLEDITLRAIRILKEVDLIAAEDTRQTLKLLNHLNVSKPLITYHRHNEEIVGPKLIEKLMEGQNIAICTDAGTPGISDPGETVTKLAIENNIQVVPIPGACALINALIASGLDTKEFSFYGFLPLNNRLKKAKFEEMINDQKTVIFYEAPHRMKESLADILKIFGDRKIVVAKELTKIHENFYRGKVSEIKEIFDNIKDVKGEFIILIEGIKIEKENELNKLSLEEHYNFYAKQNYEKKEIIKRIAKDRGVNKNEIYQHFIEK